MLRLPVEELAGTGPIHLWSYIPTCAYRCRFCQHPVVLVRGTRRVVDEKATRWVDWNIREAKLWLRDVPNLASAPIGEFNVFGGTPSLLPPDAIRQLRAFYQENFAFTPDTTISLRRRSQHVHRGQARTALGSGLHETVLRRAVLRRPGAAAMRSPTHGCQHGQCGR